MKHIKRKFQNPIQLPDNVKFNEATLSVDARGLQLKSLNIPKNYNAYIVDENNIMIAAFEHKLYNNTIIIPEPDPILIYFNSAQANFKAIDTTKRKIFDEYEKDKTYTSTIGHTLYSYMHHSTTFAIFLFTSIETMINKSIPENYVYRVDKKKFIEEYNFDQIQRYLTFEEKIKKVLFEITNKKFWDSHPTKWNHIINLKNFRDTIIHTKRQGDSNTPYSYIFKTALNFSYKETIYAVRDLINFYHPNLVEECSCGQDF